ncbi:hypothetical protein CDAR_220741 [Caerostris darwini]|uniref:Uncharacterized protein n=1 Tax=Caerostris darwini TaxID=1538125 RepID=A0AAV4PCS4_9ARAC|nr:hypothetical protein CDAR_220741 [Caerostris darwini]
MSFAQGRGVMEPFSCIQFATQTFGKMLQMWTRLNMLSIKLLWSFVTTAHSADRLDLEEWDRPETSTEPGEGFQRHSVSGTSPQSNPFRLTLN